MLKPASHIISTLLQSEDIYVLNVYDVGVRPKLKVAVPDAAAYDREEVAGGSDDDQGMLKVLECKRWRKASVPERRDGGGGG